MRNLFILIFIGLGYTASAQSDVIINTVTLSIAEGRYNDAERYLDSLLKLDPKSIDVLMMKGNVLLNYEIVQTPPLNIITIDDESIYSQDLASLKTPVVLIPKDKAFKIEKLWKQCIDQDSGRLDIREGLCTLYGMADIKNKLLDYLPIMADAGKMKGDQLVAVLIQYAKLLSERGDKEGTYEAYKKIAALYPGVPAVWSILASAYQADGDMANARLYAEKATKTPVPDPSACRMAVDIYSGIGYYTTALVVENLADQAASSYSTYPFYKAVYQYAHQEAAWRVEMKEYVKQFHSTIDSNELHTAAAYMLSENFKGTYNDFIKLLSFSNNSFYAGLIAERAMQDFKDSAQPYIQTAKFLVDGHNFAKANSYYAAAEKKKMTDDLMLEYQVQYAFALYCAGKYTSALGRWNGLAQMGGAAIFPIATYFLGQCYIKSGNTDKAKSCFQALVNSKDLSKYVYLAQLRLEKLAIK
jgi:tetratricopeptide (TPR) repeat protein